MNENTKVEKPPSLQGEEVIGNIYRQPNKPTVGDIRWLLIRRRGLLASGMAIAVTNKLSSIKHLPVA